MNKRIISLLLIITVAFAAEQLIFSDDFSELNTGRWKHEQTLGGGGNWEFQLYNNNRSNSYVKDGVLYIKPTLLSETIGENNVRGGYTMDIWGNDPASQCTGQAWYGCTRTSGAPNYLNPVQSARIRTAESFTFKYGRVEVRAKLPKGDWIWPAIWLLPRHQQYGLWPASGEIDIMESRGNANYPKEYGGGISSFGSTLHWGPDFFQNRYKMTHQQYDLPSGTFNDDFHIFGLHWTEDRIYTYLDDDSNKVLDVNITESFWDKGQFPSSTNNPWNNRSKSAPFDQEFYLVMNVAVGGTADYFADGVAGKPWSNHVTNAINQFYDAKGAWYSTWDGEKSALQVDYVKIWQDDGKLQYSSQDDVQVLKNKIADLEAKLAKVGENTEARSQIELQLKKLKN